MATRSSATAPKARRPNKPPADHRAFEDGQEAARPPVGTEGITAADELAEAHANYQRTGNTTYVWDAVRICLFNRTPDAPTLPGWCADYLGRAAFGICQLSQGVHPWDRPISPADFERGHRNTYYGDNPLKPAEAASAIASILGLTGGLPGPLAKRQKANELRRVAIRYQLAEADWNSLVKASGLNSPPAMPRAYAAFWHEPEWDLIGQRIDQMCKAGPGVVDTAAARLNPTYIAQAVRELRAENPGKRDSFAHKYDARRKLIDAANRSAHPRSIAVTSTSASGQTANRP